MIFNTFLSSLALMCLWPVFCWRLVAVISTGFCAVKTEFHSLLSQCWVFLRPSALRMPFIYRRDISISMHKLFAWDIFPHARSHHSQMTGHRLYSMHEPPNTHTHRPTQSKQQMSSLEAFCTQKQHVLCDTWKPKMVLQGALAFPGCVSGYSQTPETQSVFMPCP